jgi:hypothetical protein
VRWTIALAVGIAGCDALAGLDHLDTVFDRCAPQTFDSGRYQLSATPNHNKITFTEGTVACAQRGMEPISIDDQQEHAMLAPAITGWLAQAAPTDRYFVGLTDPAHDARWAATDQCPDPYLFWDDGQGSANANATCASLDPAAKLESGNCSGDFPDNLLAATGIVCELPRWPSFECETAAATHGMLVFDPTPRTFSEASAYCLGQHGHIVELQSSSELADATVAANGNAVWLGATNANGAWMGETGCPQILPWTGTEPNLNTGQCVTMMAAAAVVVPCSAQHPTVCELGP